MEVTRPILLVPQQPSAARSTERARGENSRRRLRLDRRELTGVHRRKARGTIFSFPRRFMQIVAFPSPMFGPPGRDFIFWHFTHVFRDFRSFDR